MTSSYDLLKDTWIYKDIRHEIAEEFLQQQLDAQRQTLLAIVQARFPRIEALAQQVTQHISEPERLQELVVRVGIARTEREARQGMSGQSDGYGS
jgi:ribosomal protein S4